MKTNLRHLVAAMLLLSAIIYQPSTTSAQGTTAFTYQGQLRDGGTNANGTYTMIFKLYDAVSGGGQIGGAITTSPTLANGIFTVDLDFGANAFNGNARWLDIIVAGDTLTPRVQVLPAPYAQFAAIAATVTNGAITNPKLTTDAVATTNLQNNAVTTSKITDGSVTDAKIASVSGAKISGAVASATFATSAASATTATTAGSATTATTATTAGSATTAATANSVTAGSITSASIASGQVVKSLNGLTDAITLSAGTNISLSTNGSGMTISAAQTATDPTVIGDWTIGTIGSGVLAVKQNGAIRARFVASGAALGLSGQLGLGGNSIDDVDVIYGHLGQLTIGDSLTISGQLTLGGNSINDVSAISGHNGQLNITGCINGSFCQTSDRNLKADFRIIDSRDILERVANLPISNWNYKTDGNTRHIGPMAQDFYAAFHVGPDDKHIATVDEGGVALAAIQGLNEKLKEKDTQIESLEKRLAVLETLIKTSAQK